MAVVVVVVVVVVVDVVVVENVVAKNQSSFMFPHLKIFCVSKNNFSPKNSLKIFQNLFQTKILVPLTLFIFRYIQLYSFVIFSARFSDPFPVW